MKLCLSQVEQRDFLLRHTGIVWPLSRATVTPLPISALTHIVQESISLLIVWREPWFVLILRPFVIQKTGINNELCMTESKEQKNGAGEQMVCFMVGEENLSLWWHYQIMICIFTVEVNNNKWNVGRNMWNKNKSAFCCDGFIMCVPLWGCSLWKCRILYIVENHAARVDTTASQSHSVDIVYNFNVWDLMMYIKILHWKYDLCLLTYIIKLLNMFLFELLQQVRDVSY